MILSFNRLREVLMVMKVLMLVFWVVTLCGLAEREEICSSETLESVYKST
jgi:hypothetical protein